MAIGHTVPISLGVSRSPPPDGLAFVFAAARAPREVATVFPTSAALAGRLLDGVDWTACDRVVELGPGAGAITGHLLARLGERSRYVGVEINPDLVQVLNRRFPGVRMEVRPAHDLDAVVEDSSVDHIVASLPWAVLDPAHQASTLARVHAALRPGGTLRTYVCAHALLLPGGRAFLRRLREVFGSVRRQPLEWRNLPPAYALLARR